MKKIFAILLVLAAAMALSNCAFLQPEPTATPEPTETDTPVPTDTATPVPTDTPVPTETATPTNTLVPTNTPRPTKTATPTPYGFLSDKDYITDFNVGDGWFDLYLTPLNKRPDYGVSYNGKEAEISIETKQTYVYLIHEDLWYDEGEPVYVETTINVTDGPYDNHMSVVCRFTEDGWYEFSIRSGGNWELFDHDNDDGYKWLDTGATYSINMRYDENTIGMLCDGDALTLFINGEKIKTVYDDTRDEGSVGFSVKTIAYGGSVYEVSSFSAINDLSMVDLPD